VRAQSNTARQACNRIERRGEEQRWRGTKGDFAGRTKHRWSARRDFVLQTQVISKENDDILAALDRRGIFPVLTVHPGVNGDLEYLDGD